MATSQPRVLVELMLFLGLGLHVTANVTSGDPPLAPSPFLPPLLRFSSGDVVSSPQLWQARRQEVATLVQEYLLGTVPPERPALTASRTLNTTTMPRNATSSFVRLTFEASAGGTSRQNISFDIEILQPAVDDSRTKLPLFLTMYTHRPWALTGLARGYIAAVVPNCDGQDIAPAFQSVYAPKYSMALIMARAFVASLTLDYVLTLPRVNSQEVAITGHSRNGKLSLVAAAFDERITAVVGSSPGAPIATPFRFSSAMYFGQDAVTSPPPSVWFSWWIAKCRTFIGRENEMPIDGHGVLGMIAPRAAAIATAWQDRESDLSFGNEMNLKESSTVYKLLGAERNLSLLYRPGDHHGFIDVGAYFDYFDSVFNRHQELPGNDAAGVSPASKAFITPAGFDWDAWRRLTGATKADAPTQLAPLPERIGWLLDTAAIDVRGGSNRGGYSVPDAYCEEAPPGQYVTLLMHHDRSKSDSRYANLTAIPFSFGQYRTATAYFDKAVINERWRAAGHKPSGSPLAPAAIWLHPYSYNRGFDTGGNNTDTFLMLAKAGYVVFAFDLAGMGMRASQGGQRYYRSVGGHGSLMGLHITDTLDLLQAVLCFSPEGHLDPQCSQADRGFTWSSPALNAFPTIDPAKVVVGGYSLGGNIALHAAALDQRIAAVFAIAAFTPLRNDTADKGTGGLRRLSHLHALVPKLGLYVGSEADLPYDYDDLLRAVAPRPALLVTPTRDRDATLHDVVTCINNSRSAWKSDMAKLVHIAPDDYSRLSDNITDATVTWASMLFRAGAAESVTAVPHAEATLPNVSHMSLMTFYDFNVTAQHAVVPREQWTWTTFYPYELAKWDAAWTKWKLPGIWNLEYLEFDGARFWNRTCAPPIWACGVRAGWQSALSAALKSIQPHIDAGGIKGIFLGDEPLLAGIAASNITAVADFIRAAVGSKPKIYWNDGCRPWYDGHVEPCTTRAGKNPASCWTNESTGKVPASVDWVSCDEYVDPTRPPNERWGTASGLWASEAAAQRYFSEHYIYPKLHPHQQVVAVPGLFGNRTDDWTDAFLTQKMQEYWDWAQDDVRVAGFNGWHYDTRTVFPGCPDKEPGNCTHTVGGSGLTQCCYKFGAAEYPKLNALLHYIGRAIELSSGSG